MAIDMALPGLLAYYYLKKQEFKVELLSMIIILRLNQKLFIQN
jgi:uncharacterized membrane protein